MLTLSQYYHHALLREYMSGVERDKTRVKATAEVFTPDELVCEILDKLVETNPTLFHDISKTFLDPSCGDGQFLAWGLFYKLIAGDLSVLEDESLWNEYDISEVFPEALSTIYGVDLMPDNIKLCHDRLLCGQEHLRHIVEKNIVCHDALTYDYSFE